jgi:hypothetical protein
LSVKRKKKKRKKKKRRRNLPTSSVLSSSSSLEGKNYCRFLKIDAFVQKREEEKKSIVRHLLGIGVFFEAQKRMTSKDSRLRDGDRCVLYHDVE